LPLATWFWIRRIRDLEPVHRVVGAPPTSAWDLLREPMMRRLMLVNWIMSSCWDVHTFVVPLVGHERGFNASVIGVILGAFAIAAALIRVIMPLFAARLRENVVVTAAMAIAALVLAVYPFTRGPVSMGVCSVVLGLALGAVQPMVMSMLHQITPHTRHGEALGLRLMALNASSVLMPLLFGSLGAVVGVSALFWLVGLVVGSGSRVAWRLDVGPQASHGGGPGPPTDRKTTE
jgi:MFS family permease